LTREQRIWTAGVIGLASFVVILTLVGSQGGLRPELQRLSVEEVLSGTAPADRFGTEELRVVGWYAELAGDCQGDSGGADPEVAWLQAECPLRVLMPYQPEADVSQEELELNGLRLAARNGQPIPPRPRPGGANLQLEQLVYLGHFDDRAAERCLPERRDRCRNTFVVEDYDGLIR